MTTTASLAARVAELEAQLALLQEERAEALGEGALLKTLIDDIAQRRAIEARLRQAHEWLNLAQEAGQVAAYSFDFQGGTLNWSPSVKALYGFEEGVTPTLDLWLSAMHPDDRAGAEAVARASIEQGRDVDQRFRLLRRDGSIAWVQDRGRIHRSPDGKPERLVGINVDVTELVQLEQRTAVSEQRLRLAMRAEQIACWDWDPIAGTVVWDENRATMRGFSPDFRGTFEAFWELVHEDDRPHVGQALDDALAGVRDYEVEFRMWRADGSLRWTHTRALVVRDAAGKPLRMVGVDADITDRKRHEAALRDNDRFLQSVLDASTDCIKVIELDGTLSYMNRNGQCSMEVTDFSQLMGQPWEKLWPAEGAALVREAKQKAMRGEASNFEAFCPTAKGTPKWWDVSVAPIWNECGEPCRIFSISRDITDRRAADEQLKLFNAELHHRIKNNLATVQAVARATLRGAPDPQTFERNFSERLMAISSTYALLRTGSDAALLADLVRNELKPYDTGAQEIAIEGPEVTLPANAALAVGMMLHELTTNACKYGSLCVAGGGLAVRWHVLEAGAQPLLVLDWVESGAPAAEKPARKGFGSQMIDRLVRQHRGTVDRDWSSDGLCLKLTLPL